MFVTFYSYKGGVGRTLALANVAYLLATNKEEPCRVLVWDFDLEAPGVPNLLRCRWRGKKEGFVDLVNKYLEKAIIPPVEDYIHPSTTSGVDLLPAGFVDNAYSSRLEKISWRHIYRRTRGYDFIQSISEAIKKIQPSYDYVLIDSRTGYSDVGGICLHQLPSTVVLMFRLNNQNLDGSRKVLKAIGRFSSRSNRPIDVIPVISPAWPFGTVEANAQIRKAKQIFSGQKLHEISFEAELTFGEKLIAKEHHRYEATPRIIGDYQELAAHIRSNNIIDPITIYKNALEKENQQQYDQANEYYSRLVELRPDNEKYWEGLVRLGKMHSPIPKVAAPLKEKISAFLDSYTKGRQQVPYAFLTRARLGGNPKQALDDIDTAIRLNPKLASAYLEKARILGSLNIHDAAVKVLNKFIELNDSPTGHLYRGLSYKALEDYENAIKDLSQALEPSSKDSHLYRLIAHAYLGKGDFAKAKALLKRSLELDQSNWKSKLLLAHSLTLLGESDAARSIAETLRAGDATETRVVDLAELYLSLEEPDRTIQLLDTFKGASKATERLLPIKDLLKHIALVLAGRDDKELEARVFSPSPEVKEMIRNGSWGFTELQVYLQYPKKGSLLPEANRKALLALIRSLKASKQKAEDLSATN